MRRAGRFVQAMRERDWSFVEFEANFRRAAKLAAQQEGDPALAEASVAQRTFYRWMRGEVQQMPHKPASIVLPYLLGVSASELFASDGDDGPLGAEIDLAGFAASVVADWVNTALDTGPRHSRQSVLASFVHWLHAVHPGLDVLAVTGAHLEEYCTAARTGRLHKGVCVPGRPLASTTVEKRHAMLRSFYNFAWQRGVVHCTSGSHVHQDGCDVAPLPVSLVERGTAPALIGDLSG